MKVSICISCFNRDNLLELFLHNLLSQQHNLDIELVIVNDGFETQVHSICEKYKEHFDIKYLFSGQRNKNELISRNPAIPNNIAIKHASNDVVLLICPEMMLHGNNSLRDLVKTSYDNPSNMIIPKFLIYENDYDVVKSISNFNEFIDECNIIYNDAGDDLNRDNIFREKYNCIFSFSDITMPFCMCLHKKHIIDIGGYDEDFTGYACEDNDFVNRLVMSGLSYKRINCIAIHLYHGKRCSGQLDFNNSLWAYNYNLFLERKKIVVRNVGKEWGRLL